MSQYKPNNDFTNQYYTSSIGDKYTSGGWINNPNNGNWIVNTPITTTTPLNGITIDASKMTKMENTITALGLEVSVLKAKNVQKDVQIMELKEQVARLMQAVFPSGMPS